jgi:hypothetical protein
VRADRINAESPIPQSRKGETRRRRSLKAPFKLISKTLKDGDAVQVVDEKDLFKDQRATDK